MPFAHAVLAGVVIRALGASKSLIAAVFSTPSMCIIRGYAAADGVLAWEAAAPIVVGACASASVTMCGAVIVVVTPWGVLKVDAISGAMQGADAGSAAVACGGGVRDIAVARVTDDQLSLAWGSIGGGSSPVSASAGLVVARQVDTATAVGVSPDGTAFELVCENGGAATSHLDQFGRPDTTSARIVSLSRVSDSSLASAEAATSQSAPSAPILLRAELADGQVLIVALDASSSTSEAAVDVNAAGGSTDVTGGASPSHCGSRLRRVATLPPGTVAGATSVGVQPLLFHIATDASHEVHVVDARGARVNTGRPRSLGDAASAAVRHGPLVRLFALAPPSSPSSSASAAAAEVAAASARLLLVWSDGYTELHRGSAAAEGAAASTVPAPLWARDEGGACVVQALLLDAFAAAGDLRTDKNAVTAGVSVDADDELPSFPSRLAAQLATLRSRVEVAVAALQSAAASPAETASALLQPLRWSAGLISASESRAAATAAAGAATAPEFAKLLVMRSQTDGAAAGSTGTWGSCSAALGASPGSGSISAEGFARGDVRWRLALPLAPSARAAITSHGAGATVSTLLALSRARPLHAHSAELILIEAVSAAREGPALVFVTWIDADSGHKTGSSSYRAAATLSHVARTPVVHVASHREAFALVHGDGTVAVVPGDIAVRRAIVGAGLDFVITDVGAVGLIATGSDASVAATGTMLDVSAEATSVAAKAVQIDKVSTVPVLLGRTSVVWRVALTDGKSSEHVLAVAHGGVGVAGTVPLVATDAGSGGAAAREAVAATSLAAAAAGESTADASSGQQPGSPAQILGDDSLLLKFLSPHVLIVATGPRGPTPSAFEASLSQAAEQPVQHTAASSASAPPLTLTLIDSVTGRVLATQRYRGGAGPVSLLRHEHWVLMTYWSARARRPEIASISMYEGVLDT